MMTWFLRHGLLVSKQYGFLEARDKFFLKVPITFRARKAFLCLPCLHSRSNFQYFWKWHNVSISKRSKIDRFVSWKLCYYLTGFKFKICFQTQKVPGPFEKRAPGLKMPGVENDIFLVWKRVRIQEFPRVTPSHEVSAYSLRYALKTATHNMFICSLPSWREEHFGRGRAEKRLPRKAAKKATILVTSRWNRHRFSWIF